MIEADESNPYASPQQVLSPRPPRRTPWVAFVLNFFASGVGLVYLGKPYWGALNCGVTAAIVLLGPRLPEPPAMLAPLIGIGYNVGCGALAYVVAKRMKTDPNSEIRQ